MLVHPVLPLETHPGLRARIREAVQKSVTPGRARRPEEEKTVGGSLAVIPRQNDLPP